jgi:hypothetical protein
LDERIAVRAAIMRSVEKRPLRSSPRVQVLTTTVKRCCSDGTTSYMAFTTPSG